MHGKTSSSPTAPVVGLVGLGLVGRAIALRLMAAGMTVLGFDLQEAARSTLEEAGGEVAASAREIGPRAGCVVLAVFSTADVIDVVEGPQGLLHEGHRVRTIIDCSTGNPESLQALAGRLKSRGVAFVEGPLSGSSQQIAEGQATQLLGGDLEAIAGCSSVLEGIATRRIHVGPAGMAARAKLATNLVLGLNRAALAEGMAFAETLGIAPGKFLELVLATPARSAAAEIKGPMMVEENFEPQSRIRQHLKDVDLMLQSAAGAGQPLPLSEAHARLMREAIGAGDGDLDNAAIIRELRRSRRPTP